MFLMLFIGLVGLVGLVQADWRTFGHSGDELGPGTVEVGADTLTISGSDVGLELVGAGFKLGDNPHIGLSGPGVVLMCRGSDGLVGNCQDNMISEAVEFQGGADFSYYPVTYSGLVGGERLSGPNVAVLCFVDDAGDAKIGICDPGIYS